MLNLQTFGIILSVEDIIIFHDALGVIFLLKSQMYHFCGIIFRVLPFMLTSNDNINDNTKYVQGKMIT